MLLAFPPKTSVSCRCYASPLNGRFWISPFFNLFLHTPSHPRLIYGSARTKQTNDNRALRQAVTSGKTHCISSWTTWPANPVKLIWDCGLVLPIMMPKLYNSSSISLQKPRNRTSWVNQNVSERDKVLRLHFLLLMASQLAPIWGVNYPFDPPH